MELLSRLWSHPLTKNIDINSADTISIHREIILSKPIMCAVYRIWYSQFLPAVEATSHLDLPMIEVGCGASHLEKYIPTILKTDVVDHSNVDKIVDATALPYPDGGLRAIFILNALHHFLEPEKFFKEADRCLAPGGRLVIVEPSDAILQKFMIQHFHPHEYWDESVSDWVNSSRGRLGFANNAIPSLIFGRDLNKFKARFPRLRIKDTHRHTFLLYFASGGLSYQSFFPTLSLPLLLLLEKLAVPFHKFLGTEMTVDIEKV